MNGREEEEKKIQDTCTPTRVRQVPPVASLFSPRFLNLSTSRYVLHKLYSCYQWDVITGEFVIREAYKFGNVVLVHLAEKTSDTQGVNGVPDIIDDVNK